MKKYLVIGNPIKHSLSPKLHNYWINQNNIEAIYEKKNLEEEEIKDLIISLKEKKINGINVTVPFKKTVIPFLDKLTFEASQTQSVNTIYLQNNEIVGHNTDIKGFEISLNKINFEITKKRVLILGSGGVVSSLIFVLNKMNVSSITISNRTREKAEELRKLFAGLNIVKWGEIPSFDIIINATSIGLKENEKINLDFSEVGKNKLFYDLIYNPKETNFLKLGKSRGNKTENGKMMFIYQAASAFKEWHNIYPEINDEVLSLLDL